jgi:hypothetical protein
MPLQIWINAFIPKTVAGYTKEIPTGPHAGKTAIPLPAIADLNPVNLWKDLWNKFDTGYLTDQRGFSGSPSASVKMQSWVEVNLSSLQVTGMNHRSSGTTEVNLKTGVVLGFKVADMKNCSWKLVGGKGSPPPGGFLLSAPPGVLFVLDLKASAGDPLVSAAADIDYEGRVVIKSGPTSGAEIIDFSGKIDTFPAFEAYASLDGKTKAFFHEPPPKGNTVTNLPGAATRPFKATVTFP